LAAPILFTFKELEQNKQKALHKSLKTIEGYMEEAGKQDSRRQQQQLEKARRSLEDY
jgi:hypothetical protein